MDAWASTNWEIYCHLEIYMETAQQRAGVVQETHLLQLRLHVNDLFFSYISPETSFSHLTSGILFLSGLHWYFESKDVFTSKNYDSYFLRLCSPATLTEAKLVQLDSNDVFAPGLEKQASPN